MIALFRSNRSACKHQPGAEPLVGLMPDACMFAMPASHSADPQIVLRLQVTSLPGPTSHTAIVAIAANRVPMQSFARESGPSHIA